MSYHCQSCSHRGPSWKLYLRHSFKAHSCDPNFSFKCTIDGCSRTFTKYSSFRAHLSRKHPNSPDPAPCPLIEEEREISLIDTTTVPDYSQSSIHDLNDCSNCTPMQNASRSAGHTQSPISNPDEQSCSNAESDISHDNWANRHAALLLLALKEKHRLTQTSVNFAVQQVKRMVEYTLEDVKVSIDKKLQVYCNEMNIRQPDISSCFTDVNPFSGLESEYLQTKFYREKFDLVVFLYLCMLHCHM